MLTKLRFVLLACLLMSSPAQAGPSTTSDDDRALKALAKSDQLLVMSNSLEHRIRALEELARAQGRVFDLTGLPAELGYDTLYNTISADPKGADMPDLKSRLARLPAPLRGAEKGLVRAEGKTRVGATITFRGRESAMVYARSTDRSPITLVIRAIDGRILCAEAQVKGRALCRWHPRSTASFVIEAELTKPAPNAALEVFTN